MPDLESSTNEDEGDFEHENVFPPDRSNTIDVVKDTVLQSKTIYCQCCEDKIHLLEMPQDELNL
ncbi:hypothetical protein DAPPUDRAFT_335162 [Daphnia pulex]|uniref:Uncharacterized protein n=1 Tax=Daphnia pulex TaxID=6669 RepID=E9HX52_DAPPU|nr:hypothetical protein DAPPUDRAFT_335162 [Daphnia pulex]|eukprot:EFX63681.1 hypothetical protein DAPPUDRAFT_335162 [Daphnia pulex]